MPGGLARAPGTRQRRPRPDAVPGPAQAREPQERPLTEPAGLALSVPRDSIAVILDEASRLPVSGILALSRAYPADPGDRQARSRMLELAGCRDGRGDEMRRLKAAAAAAVQHAAAHSHAEASLARLGALTDAELAVQDAVLAIFLGECLGEEQAGRLSRPWRDAR